MLNVEHSVTLHTEENVRVRDLSSLLILRESRYLGEARATQGPASSAIVCRSYYCDGHERLVSRSTASQGICGSG